MRKGLTKTLMAVAVAIMAMQAMAMAPVILNIPSPVVGNAENVTPANGFVYPDAIDLTKYVSDLESASTQIIWSYTTATTPKYKINNVAALNIAGGDNPVSPGAKALNNALTGGEADFDNKPLTITIRNIDLSPIIASVGTVPGTTGIQSAETQAVTLFASDQTTYSMKSVWFYTDNGGNDRLSPGITPVYGPPGSTAGYRWQLVAGAATSSNGSGTQWCITTTQSSTADVVGSWKSPYGTASQATLPLVANSAYRIRININSTQTDVTKDPYWDMTVNDYDTVTGAPLGFYGGNGYGANFFFLSNTGGANAAVQSDGAKQFTFWWCPSPVSTTRWNDTTGSLLGGTGGPFASDAVDHRNAFVEFRILQAATNLGTNGAVSFGTLCMSNLTVDRADMSSMVNLTASSPLYSLAAPSASTVYTTTPGSTFTVSFTGGGVTITPTASGSGSTGAFVAQVNPGNGVVDPTYQNASLFADDYPITMDPQTLYLVSMDLTAPAQTDMDNPPGIFWMGADSLTNELICLSWVTPVNFSKRAGPTLTASTYKALFYSNYGTNNGGLSQYSWMKSFRPRFMMGNDPTLGSGQAKTGGIKVTNIRVDKVQF